MVNLGGVAAGLRVKVGPMRLGGLAFRILSLADRDQHHDPDGLAASRGVPPAHWGFFGWVWPSGVRLADLVGAHALAGRRILEIGGGLSLAGLVAAARGSDVTASDLHPRAADFLAANTRLNGLRPIPFREIDWRSPPAALGRFDLVLASDVLYEPGHPDAIARFAEAHLAPDGELLLVDPGRGRVGRLTRLLGARGFARAEVLPRARGSASSFTRPS